MEWRDSEAVLLYKVGRSSASEAKEISVTDVTGCLKSMVDFEWTREKVVVTSMKNYKKTSGICRGKQYTNLDLHMNMDMKHEQNGN